jgi:farnesyl diphosphate synthase
LIVVYKTAFYSFYLPVALAMRMVGVSSDEAYELALSILLPLGEYFQVQDDYLDCYAPPEVLGKIGTDILVSRRCSLGVSSFRPIAVHVACTLLHVEADGTFNCHLI